MHLTSVCLSHIGHIGTMSVSAGLTTALLMTKKAVFGDLSLLVLSRCLNSCSYCINDRLNHTRVTFDWNV